MESVVDGVSGGWSQPKDSDVCMNSLSQLQELLLVTLSPQTHIGPEDEYEMHLYAI